MSQSHPWKFDPADDISLEECKEMLLKEMGTLRAVDTAHMTPGLARHFIHEETGDRGVGTTKSVDPDEAYQRAMKVCG